MKKIKLYGTYGEGLFALIDDEDFERINKYRWYLSGSGYAERAYYWAKKDPINQSTFMHKVIMETNSIVDHKNRKKLDNRKSNLRTCTSAQNSYNTRGKNKYKGVYKDFKIYYAVISHQGKKIYIGRFSNAKEAALAYDEMARKYHGEFACTNFHSPLV